MTMTAFTATLTNEERETRRTQLIGLAVWVAGEHAKNELGLDSEWNQGSWFSKRGCGTACCIAGKVALDAGAFPVVLLDYKPVTDPVKARKFWFSDKQYTSGGKYIDFDMESVLPPGATESVAVGVYAQGILHLDPSEADWLFDGGNELDDVLNIIRALIAATK